MATLAGQRKTSRLVWSIALFAVVITLADVAALLLPAWQAARAVEIPIELVGPTMGTRYSIKCWARGVAAKPEELEAAIDALLDEINQQMSTYLPESELSRFNDAPANEWFDVSPATAFVTAEALRFHRLTEGASDVTVGPLVKLWDFGPGHHPLGATLETPSGETLAKTQAETGGAHLQVRLDPPALRKDLDGLEVDLSSIAKGYAVDAVAELLTQKDLRNYMVEIGGEVRARGTRTDGKLWRIGVERPDLERRKIQQVVELREQALATSGDYRNFRVFNGNKVSHIIDPKSGRPLPYRGWSVTLLTQTCLEADALATALLVMGEERGYDWCVEHDVAALFLIREKEEIRERLTPRFQALTKHDLAK